MKKPSSDENVKTFNKKIGKTKFTFDAEPALLVHMTVSLMVFVTIQNALMEKACLVNFGHSEEVCTALVTKNENAIKYVEEEKEIHKFIGNVMVWRTVLENMFPMVLVLLIGAWSDKYGRKPPMLFILMSFVVQNIALVLCMYFKNSAGAWSVAIVSSVIPGITGNQAAFGMAIFSYVSDNTEVEKRTTRNGITHTCFFFGLTLGLAAGGIVSQLQIGFTELFVAGAVLEGLVFFYVWAVIQNQRDEKAVKGKTTGDMITDLFNTKNAKDAFSSVFKKRPGNVRTTIWILLLSHICILAPMMGEMGVFGLFGRYKFGWDGGEIAYFMTYRTVLGFLGNFISMGLLQKALSMSDPQVGIVCCLSGLLGNVVLAYANSNFAMYLGPIISILSTAALIVPRSMISKLVLGNEMGKIGSFIACIESITPLICAPLYTWVYTTTFEHFPGAFFLLSAIMMVPPMLAWTWVTSSEKTELKKK